jgi:hypothetical protein
MIKKCTDLFRVVSFMFSLYDANILQLFTHDINCVLRMIYVIMVAKLKPIYL